MVIKLDLFIDELFVFVNLKRIKLKIEIKILDRITPRFIFSKVQTLHVGVFKGLINCDSLFWIKNEHSLEHIDSLFICSLEKFSEILAARVWQFNHEFFYSLVLNLVDYSIGRPSNQIAYHHHLFLFCLGRQKGSSSDKFGQNATYTPNVNSRSVLPLREDNFGGSIPPRRNVVG